MKYIFIAVLISMQLITSGCSGQGQEDIYLSSVNSSQEVYNTHTAIVSEAVVNYNSPAEPNVISGPQVITSQEAEAMMTGEGFIILDVRTRSEFEEGHIKNAVLLPVNELLEYAETFIPDKDYVILIYCRSGNRSNQAAHLLSEMGYMYVYDFGGIISWHGEIVR